MVRLKLVGVAPKANESSPGRVDGRLRLAHSFGGLIRHPLYAGGLHSLADIKLGTPAKTFRVLLDTGSHDLWLPSASCADPNCKQRRAYDSRQSRSYVEHGHQKSICYANRVQVGGHLSIDSVQIGELLVERQAFVEATSLVGDSLAAMPFDGILGLGITDRDANADRADRSPILNILESATLRRPIFSFSFKRGAAKSESAGELILGDIDLAAYTGDIVWTRAISALRWEIRVDSIELVRGGAGAREPALSVCSAGCSAVPDTGSNLITGHREHITRLNWHLGAREVADGVFAFATTDDELLLSLPELVFRISNHSFGIPPHAYVIRRPDRYYSALRVDEMSPRWILGDVFLRNFYSIFDYENQRLGLAQSA